MPTFSELIVRTELELSQSAGTSVQIYAEDRIATYLQSTFNMVFDEMWWPDYMRWFERTLDGAQGVVTENLDTIKAWKDIRAIFPDGSDRQLRGLPTQINPYRLKGSRPVYVSRHEDDSRLIQFWPKNASGKVQIHAREKPDEFTNNDDVRMDADLLVFGAAYRYAEDDGTNPGAIQKFQNLFESRLRQLRRENSRLPIELDPSYSETIPMDWYH